MNINQIDTRKTIYRMIIVAFLYFIFIILANEFIDQDRFNMASIVAFILLFVGIYCSYEKKE
jgi:hypothetical protein